MHNAVFNRIKSRRARGPDDRLTDAERQNVVRTTRGGLGCVSRKTFFSVENVDELLTALLDQFIKSVLKRV